jgi:hypothetical protein
LSYTCTRLGVLLVEEVLIVEECDVVVVGGGIAGSMA